MCLCFLKAHVSAQDRHPKPCGADAVQSAVHLSTVRLPFTATGYHFLLLCMLLFKVMSNKRKWRKLIVKSLKILKQWLGEVVSEALWMFCSATCIHTVINTVMHCYCISFYRSLRDLFFQLHCIGLYKFTITRNTSMRLHWILYINWLDKLLCSSLLQCHDYIFK